MRREGADSRMNKTEGGGAALRVWVVAEDKERERGRVIETSWVIRRRTQLSSKMRKLRVSNKFARRSAVYTSDPGSWRRIF